MTSSKPKMAATGSAVGGILLGRGWNRPEVLDGANLHEEV